ncbi:putative late blight resistance protein R1A-3 isoform X1 [Capsicum chacoense]
MAYSIVDNLLKCLDCLDCHEDSSPSTKDQIRTLKMDLRLIRTFLMCSACRYIEDSEAKNVLMQVETLVQNAESDFQSLYVKSKDGNMPTHMALLFSNALEKINSLKAEVTQVHATVLSSTFSDSLSCDKFVAEFADCLMENLKYLREYIADDLSMNRKIITLETKIIFLKNFLRFVTKLSVENEKFQDLLTHALDVISDAAHLSYRCFTGNASEPDECGVVNGVVSSLVRRIIPINCNVIHYYIPCQKNNLSVEELDAGFVDFLLDTLAELGSYKISLGDFTTYNINDLVEDLIFLKNYLSDLPDRYPELVKLILIHIASIARNMAPSIFFLYTDGVKDEVARHSTGRLAFLQEEINLIKAEVHLMSLPGPRWMTTLKDRIQILYEEVVFLQALLNAPDDCRSLGSEQNVLFTQGQATVMMVGSLIMALSNKESDEDMLNKMELATSIFLERTRIMKRVGREIFGRGPSKFPKTNFLGFLNSFLGNLKDLLLHKADRVPFPKHHIARVHDALEYLEKKLWDVIRQKNEHPQLKHLKERVMQAAYKAEYAIDSFLVGDRNIWCSVAEMSDVVEQLKVIKAEFSDISRTVKFETVCDVQVGSSCILSRTNAPTLNDDVVVGFNDVEEKIIDGLTRGMTERDVISIVGMPGLGKTTLAKKVFNDEKVLNYFDKRAWCYVSEVYKNKELLLEILSQVLEDVDEATKMKDDADLAVLLYRKLRRKRYLIVLDDLWDIKAWDDLRRSFPDDDNGSRILVTSRLQHLASQVESDTKPDNHPTPLRFFTAEESWELLQKKVFATDCCPRNLKEPGMRIARSCHGLPLAVTLVAGILARTEKIESWWNEVAESISSYIVDDPNQCRVILELSYKHLPDYLKPCFLYFGEFLMHPHIPVQKLIWLWIAEGFVSKTEGESFEDVAEDYLTDLIGRSLVMATKKSTNGSVKVCHVHDLLREYCKRKAEEDNFFELLYKKDKCTYRDDLDDILESTYSLFPEEPRTTHNRHRLCIYSQRESFVKSKSSGPQVRSLLFFDINDISSIKSYDISPICLGFRLLRVLDLGCINVGNSFPRDIELMVQLRYLALQGNMRSVPSTIFKLIYLETFLLKAFKGEVCLPYTIWTLSKLRHLHIDARAVFGLDGYDGWNLILLENLQTVSTPSLIYEKDRTMDPNEVIRRLANLRKLRCISMDSDDCYYFPSLVSLSQLESVKILHYGQSSLSSCRFNLPSNLRRLTLSKFRLPWSEISRIGRLPHLEVLKLLCRSFEGSQWDMREGEFLKLKFLKLDSLNIEKWNISSDCLPSLEHLVLRSCKKVEEFPSCLGDIPMLRSIELHWCSLSAVNSIVLIQEEVLEYTGGEGFKVHVYPPDLDSRSSPEDHSD